jgi:DNA helicase-2/ATP-dependent DNA helicase PcrA
MFIPTPEQQAIIDHFNGHALVVAGPGSGKTTTLIAHVKKLICERNVLPKDIWVLAFNRDISSKLREKIQKELEEGSPKITTIHTFILCQTLTFGAQLLNGFEIAESLGECGIENLLWKLIAERLKEIHKIEKTSEGKRLDIRHVKGKLWTQLREYWLTTQEPDDNLFDKFKFEVERLKSVYKIVFLDELAIKFLDALKANPSFRRDVTKQRIVIDEFQDLNPTEHGILQQFHKEGTIFVVFGDDDQAVNDFRKAHADYIRDFAETYKPIQYPLARDRRCPKEILDLADNFVRGLPRLEKPLGYAPHKGKVDILNFEKDEDEKVVLESLGKKYLSLFPKYDENPQILILSGRFGTVKGRSRIAEIIEILKGAGINGITGDEKEDPLDSEWGLAFKSLSTLLVNGLSPMNLAALLSVTDSSLMKKVNKYIDEEERKGNRVDFLKVALDLKTNDKNVEKLFSDIDNLREKVKDEKFDPKIIINFIPNNLNGKNEAELVINKVWVGSQKDITIRDNNFKDSERESSKGFRFLQQLKNYIAEYIKKPEIGRVHVTSYRKAKGLEADLVIVTSVDSSDFSNTPQNRRLLYVSATRSKKNLIITFASKRSGARRYTWGRDKRFQGVPKVYRSPLIPSNYSTQEYSEEWLNNWKPV